MMVSKQGSETLPDDTPLLQSGSLCIPAARARCYWDSTIALGRVASVSLLSPPMPFNKTRLLIALGLMLGCTTAVWAQSPFTLEQIMSSPFPGELVAATHGNRVAWVFNAKGIRNVWVADGPDFIHTARQVTHYSADDGQAIASLRLTPDGKTVLYALGSELNDSHERANPETWTKGARPDGNYAFTASGYDKLPTSHSRLFRTSSVSTALRRARCSNR